MGAVWVYGRMVAVQAINFLAVVILARQLDPKAFGLVALANLAISFLQMLAAQGVNQYIIYDNAEGSQERARGAFWLALSIALCSMFAGLAAASPLSRFFGEPQLANILTLLVLRLPLEAVTRISDSTLNKRLIFKNIEIRDTVVQIASSMGSVAMALGGFGVWSLVIPAVALSPVQAVAAYALSGWRPGWNPQLRLWPRILSYSSSVIGSTFTAFVLTEGDTLLVGRLMGPFALGLYNLAWRTSNLVSRNIVTVSNKLSFPLFSAIVQDQKRSAGMLRRLLKILSGVTFPLLVWLLVVADDFVHVVYGAKWLDAVLPLRILIIYAIRYSVGSPLGPLLNAMGKPDIAFKLQSVTIPFYIGAIWIGSFYGIVGVAAGVTLIRTALGMVLFWTVAEQLKVGISYLLRPMLSSFAAASMMGVIVLLLKWGWESIEPSQHLLKLVVLTVLGCGIYLLLIRHWFRDVAFEYGAVLNVVLGRRALVMYRLLNINL